LADSKRKEHKLALMGAKPSVSVLLTLGGTAEEIVGRSPDEQERNPGGWKPH